MPDWWENKFFSGNSGPEEDPDHDGLTNWQESRAGTDPLSPGSSFRFAKVESPSIGSIRLSWPSVENQQYVLLRSSSLDGTSFTVLQARILATPPMNSYLDANATGAGPYFYRLKLED